MVYTFKNDYQMSALFHFSVIILPARVSPFYQPKKKVTDMEDFIYDSLETSRIVLLVGFMPICYGIDVVQV